MASRAADPEPALPANLATATASDIRAHHAWSDRNGRPRQVFPQEAAMQGPRRRGGNRRGRPGAPVPALPAHGEVRLRSNEEDGWQRGTWIVNKTEYARRANGQIRKLRSWNSRT